MYGTLSICSLCTLSICPLRSLTAAESTSSWLMPLDFQADRLILNLINLSGHVFCSGCPFQNIPCVVTNHLLYLLPSTCCLRALVTCCQAPAVTSCLHLSPVAKHLLPSTCHLYFVHSSPAARHLLPAPVTDCCQALAVTWCLLPAPITCCQAPWGLTYYSLQQLLRALFLND